jgi:hypothetical protein
VERGEGAEQRGTGATKLGAMRDAEALEDATTACGDDEDDLAPIARAWLLAYEPTRDTSCDELDGAVVLDLQALGDASDRRRLALREATDGEQELVLLRLEARVARGGFAEDDEAPDAIADLGESAVFGNADDGHGYNIS